MEVTLHGWSTQSEESPDVVGEKKRPEIGLRSPELHFKGEETVNQRCKMLSIRSAAEMVKTGCKNGVTVVSKWSNMMNKDRFI